KSFRATAGQLDSSRETSQVVRMQVLLDGRVAFSKDVGFNESSSVDLDVSGTTRMRLQVTLLDQQFSSLRAGFGEPFLIRSS
ncbi:MAG TPA: NPCBM/NEW2 domain-containing protein, partial [Acidimicrobiales bacterium]|nr:NPCBM/NEW2 domain-containing protein [Acidimicrobiales bacterium]